MAVLFTANITQAQTVQKKKIGEYPVFSLAPYGGIQFPMGSLGETYKSSFNAGLDVNMKINKETSFFLNAGYYDMPLKSDRTGPAASFIAITAGPRYVFSSASVKAKFFLEAGLGVYIFGLKEHTTTVAPIVTTPSSSTVNFGLNTGPGVVIPVSDAMDILMKSKLHYVLNADGSSTFISASIGLDFKL